MLALYPSNKLEHLSFLLTTLLKQQPTGVFEPETILVESPGMQHWFSMQLAQEQGIAMNIEFPLPVRFMWNTARTVLGSDTVPKQSPYRREVLTWRIDNLLQDESLLNTPSFEQVTQYWKMAGSPQEQGVQRLQLATALADVYEQYLLYRPDWLFAWENKERVVFDDMEVWQSEIWRELTKSQPLHPARLHQMTLEALEAGNIPDNLPQRVIVFAINTMAPQLIAFFDALAAHIDIHIFHLNPSVNYWGDAKSSAEQARQLRTEGLDKWMGQEQSNPLLGNLGKQGRELFNLLTDLDTFEISAFDAPRFSEAEHNNGTGGNDDVAINDKDEKPNDGFSLLDYIHDDVLQAIKPVSNRAILPDDDSITVMCTHSALREVQVLHDHLLHWLSQDLSRTPSDILVMCPAIENYAPFVDTVFHRVGTKPLQDNGPVRLPCSIADRSPMDAEPLIAAFMALLQLPDSRFGVSDVMDYLQLDAVQQRFDVSQDDIDQMTVWLKQAHIHWGLNAGHKSIVSENEACDDTYSWWWGIRRLLMGMLAPDSEMVVEDLLTIPDVEGQSTLTLGKLIDVIQLLGEFATSLTVARTPSEWGRDLIALRDACFKPSREQDQSWDLIAKVAADLAARCEEADYSHKLTLRQVRELLLNRFSSPDAGNHFMTGQVTVCSMLPMRSIPFKKVCILGLNDSEFPRKSTPLGLDLMAGPERRLGDRSRRLEDRYLFLEAIVSSREGLYLSYQGNDVTNNSERQPSLVLAEFLEMLELGYNVELPHYVKHAALHPFSETAFAGGIPSYETGWLRLAQALKQSKGDVDESLTNTQNTSPAIEIPTEFDGQAHFSTSQVARAFEDPLDYFATQRLGVNLSQSFTLLENSEPFETNALVRYQVLDAIFSSPSRAASMEQANNVRHYSEQVIDFFALRGDIPNNPVAKEELQMWKEGALALNQAMGPHDADLKTAAFTGQHITITANAYAASDALQLQCAGKISVKRALEYYITQLVFCAQGEEGQYQHYPLNVFFCDWDKGDIKLMKRHYTPLDAETATEVLLFIEHLFVTLYSSPTPMYSSLFAEIIPGKRKSDSAAIVAEIQPALFGVLSQLCLQTEKDMPDIASSENTQKAVGVLRDITDFLHGSSADKAIKTWLQSSGQFNADMVNNPYLKWLFPDGIAWTNMPATHAFVLFSMVANAAQEETL